MSEIKKLNVLADGPAIQVEPVSGSPALERFAENFSEPIECIKCGKKFVQHPGKNVCPVCGHEQELGI